MTQPFWPMYDWYKLPLADRTIADRLKDRMSLSPRKTATTYAHLLDVSPSIISSYLCRWTKDSESRVQRRRSHSGRAYVYWMS